MQKLQTEIEVLVKNAIEIASVLGIETVVVDNFSLRGENKELGVCIIVPTKDLKMDFDALGIGRIVELKKRIGLLEDGTIQYELNEKNEEEKIVSTLKITQGRSKVSFRCHNPKKIEAPKAINDPIFYEMTLSDNDVNFLIKGVATMSSEAINFSTVDGKVSVNLSDAQGDVLNHELESDLEVKDDSATDLSKRYKAKTLATIFRNYIKKDDNDILPISITRRGVMRLTIMGMFVYLFPER